jgi:diketogulonate reductase-like aldo/keto reductase
MPVMAYSPIEQGRLVTDEGLGEVAGELGVTPAQVALAWLLARDGVIAIPKAGTVEHVRENRAAADLALLPETLARLDAMFPLSGGPVPLAIL